MPFKQVKEHKINFEYTPEGKATIMYTAERGVLFMVLSSTALRRQDGPEGYTYPGLSLCRP